MFGPNGGVAKKYEAHGNKDAATVARANITQQTADKIKQQGARVLQAVETQRSQYRAAVAGEQEDDRQAAQSARLKKQRNAAEDELADAQQAAKRRRLDRLQQDRKLDGAMAQFTATHGPRFPRATNK